MRRLFLWSVMVCVTLGSASIVFANNNFLAGGDMPGPGGTTQSAGGWEIRNSGGGFVTSGALWAARRDHCAVKLTTGNIMLVGGSFSSGTWEIRNTSVGW